MISARARGLAAAQREGFERSHRRDCCEQGAGRHAALRDPLARGVHTSIEMPKPVAGKESRTTDEDLDIIRRMAVRYGDDQIANVLNRLGRRTGKGKRWNQSRVASARKRHGIAGQARTKPDPDVLSLNAAAAHAGVSDTTIRRLVEAGLLPCNQVAPRAPWEIPPRGSRCPPGGRHPRAPTQNHVWVSRLPVRACWAGASSGYPPTRAASRRSGGGTHADGARPSHERAEHHARRPRVVVFFLRSSRLDRPVRSGRGRAVVWSGAGVSHEHRREHCPMEEHRAHENEAQDLGRNPELIEVTTNVSRETRYTECARTKSASRGPRRFAVRTRRTDETKESGSATSPTLVRPKLTSEPSSRANVSAASAFSGAPRPRRRPRAHRRSALRHADPVPPLVQRCVRGARGLPARPARVSEEQDSQHLHGREEPRARVDFARLWASDERFLSATFVSARYTAESRPLRYCLRRMPSMLFHDPTRSLVLEGADGVVFVADSQHARREANMEARQDLRRHLDALGRDPAGVPIILQYNKRDLTGIADVATLRRELNPEGRPDFEAVAWEGVGVVETFTAMTALLVGGAR